MPGKAESSDSAWPIRLRNPAGGSAAHVRDVLSGDLVPSEARGRAGAGDCQAFCGTPAGRIWVESAPGRGSRLYLGLPLAEGVNAELEGLLNGIGLDEEPLLQRPEEPLIGLGRFDGPEVMLRAGVD